MLSNGGVAATCWGVASNVTSVIWGLPTGGVATTYWGCGYYLLGVWLLPVGVWLVMLLVWCGDYLLGHSYCILGGVASAS